MNNRPYLKNQLSKIVLFMIITGLYTSCNSVKRVSNDQELLTKNTLYVNNTVNKKDSVNNIIIQHPNKTLLGIPIKLHVYNSARPNIDSILKERMEHNPKHLKRTEAFLSKKQHQRLIQSKIKFNQWLKEKGEAPVIIDDNKAEKSANRLKAFFFNNGWFDAQVEYSIDSVAHKKANVIYNVNTGAAYKLDTISTQIKSPIIDSLYQKTIKKSLIKSGEQYRSTNFEKERERLTTSFRNNGVFHFSQEYIRFSVDTIGKTKKANVEIRIQDRTIKTLDSTSHVDFKIYTVKEVNIYPDFSHENRNATIRDTINYDGYNIYTVDKLKYKPKAITNAVFISPGKIFRDIDRTRTYRHLSELKTFKYPNIEYIENTDVTLTVNIYLSPLEKFNLNLTSEVSQSNIQALGISFSPSVLSRNVFKGAETLQLSLYGSIGASKDTKSDEDPFFDIRELGADLSLNIPRLLFPVKTDKLIPKYMLPSTRISMGVTSQTNVGLDKQTITGTFNYKWQPSRRITNRLDLFNIQYVRNLNPDNYFNVYQSSYQSLNNVAKDIGYIGPDENLGIPNGTNQFINTVLSDNPPPGMTEDQIETVNDIDEREQRLTENNLIVSSSFTYFKDSRRSFFDENFYNLRLKLELAGNLLSSGFKLLNEQKNENGKYELLNVPFSQYVKTELDYIKHWDLGGKRVLAFRSFFGIAIPYGNSDNIPFSKSFFAGGTNDNRAWTAYSLGPGRTRSYNDFNEANLKIAFNLETRFNLLGDLNGAFFVDAGNIWNVLDNITDEASTFTSLKSLEDIALGSGFGLRYDFGFVVFRFDIGFKTYDPTYPINDRWFNDYNFGSAVYNIGINYPF